MENDDDDLFQNRYRIPSTRLSWWDYADAGSYFVTICTQDKLPWFGEIVGKTMVLSDVGRIVDDEWKKTAIIRPYVSLDEYVIMPDHFHGIINIGERTPTIVETPRRGVSTTDKLNNHQPKWSPGCLGAIINQFKMICTKRIRETYPDFTWQPRFHDRRIRNDGERIRIRKYIRLNPIMADLDEW